MDIVIESSTEVKQRGVKNGLARVPYFNGAEFYTSTNKSGVRDQPWGVDEIFTGAINRAKGAYGSREAHFGAGVESGAILVAIREGFSLNFTACVLWDGKKLYPGCGMSFKIPDSASELMRREIDLQTALHLAGITDDPKIGKGKGLISLITNGEFDRARLIEQATYIAGSLVGKIKLGY